MSPYSEAVILAGGEGSRLGPLTRYRPKPMVPIANRPVIEYVVDALLEVGIDSITVVVGYRGDRIQDHLEHAYSEDRFTYVTQRKQLGSGHALKQAEGLLDGEFLLVNGDTIVGAGAVRQTIERHEAAGGHASAAVVESERPEDYGAIDLDDGRVVGITENPRDPRGYLINAGVYVLPPGIFDELDRIEPRDGEYYVTDALVNLEGDVCGVELHGLWLDPSYPWDVLSVTESILTRHPELVSERDGFEDGVLIADSANLHPTAVVEPPAVVGANCEVNAGSIVRSGTCLGRNTHVGPHTVVDRSITGFDAHVGGSVHVRDCLIGDGTSIGDGTVLAGGPADVFICGRVHTDRSIGGIVADRVRVGEGVTVSPGVKIGPHASIAPGTTVRHDVSERAEVRG